MNFFSDDLPLGPNSTPKVFDDSAFAALFDKENELYRSLSHNPLLLVGRRGSGKTAFLRCRPHLDKSCLTFELSGSGAFRHIVNTMNKIFPDEELVFAEDICELWKKLFNIICIKRVLEENFSEFQDEMALMESYLKAVFQERVSEEIHTAFTILLRRIVDSKNIGVDFLDILNIPHEACPSQAEAFSACVTVLQKKGVKIYILIDNLEEFRLETEKMGDLIKGLLKSINEYSSENSMIDVVFCIPSELYYTFSKISTNPLKGFERSQILQWTSKELLHLCAHRYEQFIKSCELSQYGELFRNVDMDTTSGSKAIWRKIFPREILNGNGITEDPVAFILRHSQLLPRQLIDLLNSIISFNLWSTGSRINIANDSFFEGLRAIQHKIVEEVLVAFKFTYPSARTSIDLVLQNIGNVTEYSLIHKQYNTLPRQIRDDQSFGEFIKMLAEIGVVGVYRRETDRYIVAEFEYTMPSRLKIKDTDRLCVHPIFMQIYRVNQAENKLIYPYGTMHDDEYNRKILGARP